MGSTQAQQVNDHHVFTVSASNTNITRLLSAKNLLQPLLIAQGTSYMTNRVSNHCKTSHAEPKVSTEKPHPCLGQVYQSRSTNSYFPCRTSDNNANDADEWPLLIESIQVVKVIVELRADTIQGTY